MFIYIITAVLILIVIVLICVAFISTRRNEEHNIDNHTNHDNDQLNKFKLNKRLKVLKKLFNGEEKKDCQLFFINKNDVTDIKLPYELLSAKAAVENNDVSEDYRSINFDDQNKYFEYKITHDGKLKDNNSRDYDSDYHLIELSQKVFMNESNFDNENDLVSYYKAIIESKKN